MKNHGGFLLVDTLIGHGITNVFGMPGGQANAFYDALGSRKDKITHTLIRDETTAGYAAEAFARVSGRIGVCDATVGPGVAKLPTGLMEAYNSSIPILAIISDHPRNALLLQDYGRISQGGDQMNMLKPFAKETFSVQTVDMIPKVVAAAIHTAVSGRPGPVVVEIPQDVYNDTSDVEPISGVGSYPKHRCTASRADVAAAVVALKNSERPLILAGGGTQISQAYDEVTNLSELCGIPVVTTLSGKGIVNEASDLSLGVLGEFGNTSAKKVADQADVILAIGYKHSQNSSYRWTWPRKDQILIHIDIDPAEFGRIYQADVSLWGDAKETLCALISSMKEQTFKTTEQWRALVLQEKNKWEEIRISERNNTTAPIWPQSIIKVIEEQIGEDDYVIYDASFSSGYGAAYQELSKTGRHILLPRGAAGLGYSLPAAIGVCMAKPNARVITVAGDGAFSYNVGELATLKQLNLPITNIVLNNSVLGWSKWTQQLNFRGNNHSVELGSSNFAAVDKVYDISGYNIKAIEELAPVLEKELKAKQPSVINVYTDQWQTPNMAYRESMEKVKKGKVTAQEY